MDNKLIFKLWDRQKYPNFIHWLNSKEYAIIEKKYSINYSWDYNKED